MVWSSWGKSWGSSGSSETIIVDSFDLDVAMEEVIFEEAQEFEIFLDPSECVLEQEEHGITFEEQEFVLELEE